MQKKIIVKEIPSKVKIIEKKKEERDVSSLEAELNQHQEQMRSTDSRLATPTLIADRINAFEPRALPQREKLKEIEKREGGYEANGQGARESYETPSQQQERNGQFIPPTLSSEDRFQDESRNIFRGRSDFQRDPQPQRREYTSQVRTDQDLNKKKKREWNF